MKAASLFALLLLAANLAALAADSPEPAALTDEQSKGRALFNESCSFCHGARGHATTLLAKRVGQTNGMLERRTDLQADLIRHVVRHGINSMPWYRRAELSDAQLERIAAYLTRANPGQ